ncbi:hypothetical protein [Priestia megaterium]|nr:hypothetical protein [Priestia megaterium]
MVTEVVAGEGERVEVGERIGRVEGKEGG